MNWLSGGVVALSRGFWNRLQGLLADDSSGIMAVQRLAATSPTTVDLSTAEAGQLFDAGKAAQLAAQQWWLGADPESIVLPQVPGPEWPNIFGGEPGNINFGIIINDPQNVGSDIPILASADHVPSVQDVLDALFEFIMTECGGRRKSWGDCRDAREILAEALHGGPNTWMIGWQLWERIEPYFPE